jgi:hypothetical protein
MHLQVCGGEEKGRNTCTHVLASLASSGGAGCGVARKGDAMDTGA